MHVLSAKFVPPPAPAPDAEILTHPAHVVATEFYQPGRDRHFVASWFGGGSKDPIKSLDDAPPAIENDLVKAEIASTTGLLRRLTDKRGGQRSKLVEHVFKRYTSSSSGAYLFRPQNSNMLFPDAGQLLVRVYRGPVAQTVSTRWEAFAARMRLVGDGRLAGFGAGAEALKYDAGPG